MNRFALSFSVLCCYFASSAASGVVIDDFSSGFLAVESFGRDVEFDTPADNIADRRTGSTRGFLQRDGLFGARLAVTPSSNTLTFDSRDLCCGYFDLEYGSEQQPLDLDLSVGGADRLRFRLSTSGRSPAFSVTFRDDSQRIGSASVRGPAGVLLENYVVEVLFGDLFFGDTPPNQDRPVESLVLSAGRFIGRLELDLVEIAGPGIVGDFNRDGRVGVEDFSLWQRQFGLRVPGSTTDANRDGEIDLADFTIWRDAFAATRDTLQRSTNVPSPTARALALAGCAVVAVGRWRGGGGNSAG